MNLSNKKILITGGSGFIGSNLISELKKKGAQVDAFDLSCGDDILNYKAVKRFVRRKYHIIFHLAGYSGSVESNKYKRKFFEVNTLGTANLLQLIAEYSPKTKLIISSSRLEYGNPQYLPVDEKHPLAPTSAYGLSKLAATQLALIYHDRYNLDVTIFRTSNTYGPHPKERFKGYNVINYFIDLARRNKAIKIFGGGNQLRDYIYISDLVKAFILSTVKNPKDRIFNLGFGKGIKLKQMAKIIIETVGRGRLEIAPWPRNFKSVETGNYLSDISLAKKELGFEPKINFRKGIELTVK